MSNSEDRMINRPSSMTATKIIHEVSAPLEIRVESLDLPALQAVFAVLFDRAGEGILQAGLDFDDVELHRFVEVRADDGTTFVAPVEWLSDRRRLVADIRAAAARHCRLPIADCRLEETGAGLVIVAAKVRAVADGLP